ncbi:hypothetical protein H8356DRAFT_1702531 [Neocallimastix lanati (nom. inval.)]|nr:hypothetical protein H8356DRAFT_1702531 [Neocallimastix sp. JGI-2020a]
MVFLILSFKISSSSLFLILPSVITEFKFSLENEGAINVSLESCLTFCFSSFISFIFSKFS